VKKRRTDVLCIRAVKPKSELCKYNVVNVYPMKGWAGRASSCVLRPSVERSTVCWNMISTIRNMKF